MAFTAGQKVRASELNATGVLIARGRRTTNSAAGTGVIGVLRLDDVPVTAGRCYLINARGGMWPTAAGDTRADVTVRFTTTGATPTTASPILALVGRQLFTTGYVEPFDIAQTYTPGSNQLLSLLLCFDSIDSDPIAAYGAADWPVEILVTDLGADPGNTGVAI